MKELEVELEQLMLLVTAMVGREVDNKVGENDERDAWESSPQPGRR